MTRSTLRFLALISLFCLVFTGPDNVCSEDCSWRGEHHTLYSFADLGRRTFQTHLPTPDGAQLRVSPCQQFRCSNQDTGSCITVPGLKPTNAGMVRRYQSLRAGAPNSGFKLILEEGELCEVTKKPRETILMFPCDPHSHSDPNLVTVAKAYEGQKKLICKYFVEFSPSIFGCPLPNAEPHRLLPELLADSDPHYSTSGCHHGGGQLISLHGLWFFQLCNTLNSPVSFSLFSYEHKTMLHLDSEQCSAHFRENYSINVGSSSCINPVIVSPFLINCTLTAGSGEKLTVEIVPSKKNDKIEEGTNIYSLPKAVTYKEVVDLRDMFNRFTEYGVGGLNKEISELYRRAFASRGTSPDVLSTLGVSHVKGILLYGPPGAGKTLLAKTLAKILGTEQVSLINGPEIISKYLGESERNLRAHFQAAQEAYKKHGASSDLYVIIIDEVEAICKPRGKTDHSSAAAAYDSLVNQLLTLMDGLNELNNLIVIGMTNRKELMDPALLRPGRFEVQIEVGLPDEKGRYEIFEIHTRAMRNNGVLSDDVDLHELAANTTRFSGAEIAGVVRAAASYALEKQHLQGNSKTPLVALSDFQKALLSFSPAYTQSEAEIVSYLLPTNYLSLGAEHEATTSTLLDIVHSLHRSSISRMQSVLLYGSRGTGKTSLAAHIAVQGHFSFVKILSASSLIGLPDVHKVERLQEVFQDAFQSESAMVVLDDLQRIVEHVQVASHLTVSHAMMHVLSTLLTSSPPTGSKVLVVGTITAGSATQLGQPTVTLGLPELFTWHLPVPGMGVTAIQRYLSSKHVLRHGGGSFTLPFDLVVPVKKLQHAIECACYHPLSSCSTPSSYTLHQDQFMDCITRFVLRSGETTSKTSEIFS